MLKRGCAIDADTRSSMTETLATGTAGSTAASADFTPFTIVGES